MSAMVRHDPLRYVYFDDLENIVEDGPFMEFKLTYRGVLKSTANDGGSKAFSRTDHKHDVRMAFHPQLKRLWDVTPFLKTGERSGTGTIMLSGDAAGKKAPPYKASYLAKKHGAFGWGFVPLVTRNLGLMCAIEVLFLRPGVPGKVMDQQGDIDGRIKTLFDALSIPDANQNYHERQPFPKKRPMYVLMEDDTMVSKMSVETDQLLDWPEGDDPNMCQLFITVKVRPYDLTLDNMQFG